MSLFKTPNDRARDIAACKYAGGEVFHSHPFCQYENLKTGTEFRLIGPFENGYTEGWTFKETFTAEGRTWDVFEKAK